MTNVSKTVGAKVTWGATHKKGGRLISRQASIEPPTYCGKIRYIPKFLLKSWRYALLLIYHKYRTEYAEAYPDSDIKWKYRTGEDSPEGIWSSIWGIIKVKTRRLITWLQKS